MALPLGVMPARTTGCVSTLEQVQHVSIVIDFLPAIRPGSNASGAA
jgi:hypothetical protein